MSVTVTHPLTQLVEAEAKLVASIDAATARLNAVGTTSIEQALLRFQDAAIAAAERLSCAGRAIGFMAGEVVADLAELAGEINAAVTPIAVELPALPTFEEIQAEGDSWREEMAAQDQPGIAGIPSGEGETIDLAEDLPFTPGMFHAQEARQDTPTMQAGHHVADVATSPQQAGSEPSSPADKDTRKPGPRPKPRKRPSTAATNGTH